MCLQGFDQSGQEQSVSRSRSFSGKSESLLSLKACSMSCGISPAISLAAKMAWLANAVVSFCQSLASSCLSLMVILYGVGDEPCTFDLISPLAMSIESTWPLRAYDRPRLSRAPMLKLSSVAIQRFAHQLSPKLPRFDCDLIPPLALIRGFGL